MTAELQKYIEFLKNQKTKANGDLKRAERSISRIDEKLADPEKAFKAEYGRGHKKVSRIVDGGEVVKKPVKTILVKKNSEGDEKLAEELAETLRDAGFSTSSRYHDDEEESEGFGFFK